MADLGLYLGVFMINFVGAAIAVGICLLTPLKRKPKISYSIGGVVIVLLTLVSLSRAELYMWVIAGFSLLLLFLRYKKAQAQENKRSEKTTT